MSTSRNPIGILKKGERFLSRPTKRWMEQFYRQLLQDYRITQQAGDAEFPMHIHHKMFRILRHDMALNRSPMREGFSASVPNVCLPSLYQIGLAVTPV